MASPTPQTTGLSSLPPELLSQIFKHVHLTSPAPSSTNLNQQPTSTFLTQPPTRTPLKNISLTSHLHRSITLPLLFRHVLWHADVDNIRATFDNSPHRPVAPFMILRFLIKNGLAGLVQSLTMVITDETATNGLDLKLDGPAREANAFVWESISNVVDVRRLTIVAPPRTMVGMLSPVGGWMGHGGKFGTEWHVLSLGLDGERPLDRRDQTAVTNDNDATAKVDDTAAAASTSPEEVASSAADYVSGSHIKTSPLLTLRPWTSILLNEGSFLPAYRHPSAHDLAPPSILPSLLVGGQFVSPDLARLTAHEYPSTQSAMLRFNPHIPPSFPRTATRFTYVALFPLAGHFRLIPDHLPRIKHLHLQLTPAGLDLNTTPDPLKGQFEPWSERNMNYGITLQTLFKGGNWNYLETLESGDQADGEAWQYASEWAACQGRGWKVGGDGVMLIERPEEVYDGDEVVLPLPEELKRVAFRGTAKLPVSTIQNHQML